MTVVVFLGPTLPVDEAKRIVDGVYLGPVSQGDVYRASRQRPDAIAIVDGYFNQVPAVWHKEILWALASGIRVFGSSSMGALRAAELEHFGMVGVGKIFEAFRSGELEDDDEVALLHASVEDGYLPITEAMVNVRATLLEAERQGVLRPASRVVLEETMKRLNYTSRCYQTMVALAAESHAVDPEELEVFVRWLPTGRVDQKAADAIHMLQCVKQALSSAEPPSPVQFDFAYTAVFDELRRTAGSFDASGEGSGTAVFTGAVLDEARLAPDWERHYWQGLSRRLALQEAQRYGLKVDEQVLFEAIVQFRRRRNLLAPADLDSWLVENHLTRAEFVRLMETDAKVGAIRKVLEVGVQEEILDSLRLESRYAELAERAIRKRAILEAVDANPPSPEVYEAALASYFEENVGCGSAKLPGLAAARGFANADALLRTVLVEHIYQQSTGDRGDDTHSP